MRIVQVLGRHDLEQMILDVAHVLAGREARAIRDAEDVGVDRDRRLPERRVQDDVRRLAADAGQRFERFARLRAPRRRAARAGCGTSR